MHGATIKIIAIHVSRYLSVPLVWTVWHIWWTEFWWGDITEGDHLEDAGVD